MSLHTPARLRRTALTNVAAVALLLSALTACGGSDAGTEPAGSAAKPAAEGAEDADKKAVSAADLCGFLEKNVAEWQSIGSEVGAMARLTTDLASFYEDHGVTPVGSDMDEQTLAECPEVRTKVLKAGGLESFRTL
ncbi:hypothetical protein [Actinoplanes sp. NPDC049599]|uniref:hypothetical protein n=1 Tax=Actinoplanes sp. NPDC049599 TaxID=3363903 RepID=UPI00378C8C50